MPRRGEIWWVNLDPTIGSEINKTRPCLVISASVINEHRRTVVVIPLSTSPQEAPPLLVPVRCAGKPVMAAIDQVRTVAKKRLNNLMERLSAKDLESVETALREVLELD